MLERPRAFFRASDRKERTRSVPLQPEEHIQVVAVENQSGTPCRAPKFPLDRFTSARPTLWVFRNLRGDGKGASTPRPRYRPVVIGRKQDRRTIPRRQLHVGTERPIAACVHTTRAARRTIRSAAVDANGGTMAVRGSEYGSAPAARPLRALCRPYTIGTPYAVFDSLNIEFDALGPIDDNLPAFGWR